MKPTFTKVYGPRDPGKQRQREEQALMQALMTIWPDPKDCPAGGVQAHMEELTQAVTEAMGIPKDKLTPAKPATTKREILLMSKMQPAPTPLPKFRTNTPEIGEAIREAFKKYAEEAGYTVEQVRQCRVFFDVGCWWVEQQHSSHQWEVYDVKGAYDKFVRFEFNLMGELKD